MFGFVDIALLGCRTGGGVDICRWIDACKTESATEDESC